MFWQTRARRFCPDCDRYTLAHLRSANILGHTTLVLFTCGLWLPFALAVAAYYGIAKPAECSHCGARC